MSLLQSLVEQFIRDGDEKQSESLKVMQKHPVVYLSKCSEILDELSDIGPEYIRILKIMVQVAGLLNQEENARLAVIQSTQVLKRTINRILILPQVSEELNQLLTDIHIKLMDVFDELIINHISDFFESGRVPEVVILKIIEQMFQSQAKDYFKQFSNEILQKILSSLSLVKNDQVRLDYCSLLQSIYKTLIHFEENQVVINTEQVCNVTWLIFDQIIKDWLTTPTQMQVLSLIGFMSAFITKDRLERNLEKLTQVYLAVLKVKNNQLRPLFEGFNKFLERLYQLDRLAYEGIVKSIMVSLYEFYKSPIFSPNYPFDPNALKYKNDLLTLLQTVSRFNIDNCLDLFIGRINSKDTVERVSCLWICNFLLSRNFRLISEPYKRQLVLQLLNLQFEQDCEVRYAICEIVLQIYYKLKDDEQPISQTYLDVKALLFYLFNQVSIHDKELEEYGKQRAGPFETTLELLKIRAQKILTTLSQDQYFYDLLWPMGLEIINNQKFSPGLSHIFKCYSVVLQKMNTITVATPVSPHVIMVRMLLLIQIPYFFQGLGLEAVNFLPHLVKTFDLKVPSSFHQNVETLKLYLSNKKQLDEFYEERVQQIWKVCLAIFIQTKELSLIEEDFQVQMNMYLNSQALKLPIMKMQATLMSFLSNQETIKYNLDKLFSICHQEYTNQALNLNVPIQEPEFTLRLCVAECFGYIGERHTQLVLDKVKSILNCEVIQKKASGSFKESVFSMFQKSGSEEYLASFRATLLIAYGCLAKQVSLEVLEKNILPNVMPFIGHEGLFNSLQISLESISKAIERQIENTDEALVSSFLLSYQKYREQVLQHCQKNLNRGNMFRNLNTIDLQYRLAPAEFSKIKLLLSQHLDAKYDLMLEHVNVTFQNCFLLFLGTVRLEEDGTAVSVWQSLLYLIKSIKDDDSLIEVLQKSIQRVKLKMEQSHKNYFKVILMLLSILYRNTAAKRSIVLILEKVLLSLGVYLDIYQKTDEEFNFQLIKSLREKLLQNEMVILMQEIQVLINEPIVDSLHGFASLVHCIQQSGYKDLNRVVTILQCICTQGQGSTRETEINTNLSIAMELLATQNLQETLEILLETKQEFPVGTFCKLFLKQVCLNKQHMAKSFVFLTDVLNNPEGIITGDLGNYLINGSLFIGQLLADENKLLTEMLPKQMAGILGTFILRFMTCHDPHLGASQSVQSAIWAFQNLLSICSIEGISQHVFKKLLTEEEVQDGVQEIIMIYAKTANFADQKKLFDFIKEFTTKEQASYRLGAIVVTTQFIRSHREYNQSEFYEELIQTLLQFAEDDSDNVRAQVAFGLGGLSYYLKAGQTLSEELTQEVLECLIALLDDQQEICIRSAMISLQNLVDSLPDCVAYLPQLMLTTTANFERSMTKIRISAFSLFSKLCHICYVQQIMNESIMVHLRQALVSIMLHLLDESVQVRQVCKLSLENVGELLENTTLKSLSNDEIVSQEDMSHLDENEKIIMVMTLNLEQEHLQSYIKSLIEFCKSPEHTIKGAAMFSLILLLAFREVGDYRAQIEQVCQEGKLRWTTKSLVIKAAYYL